MSIFAITLAGIMAFGATFAFGYAAMNDGRVLPGVQVSGISVSGMNRSAAESRLKEALPDLSAGALTVQVGQALESIAYSDIDRDYDYDFMLDQAFSVGRGGNFVDQLREQLSLLVSGASVRPAVTWDSEELTRRVAALAAAGQIAARDASVTRTDGRYIVTPAVDGISVDVQEAVSMAMSSVNSLSPSSTQIAVQGSPVIPTVTTEAAQAAVDRVESVVGSALTVSGDGLSTTISSDTLRGWVYLNEQGPGEWQVTIEAEPIAQYLRTYALTADEPATNATFGFEGGTVQVIPSAVGSVVDVETTTANVLGALQARADGQAGGTVNLATVPVEPEFTTADAQALASRVTMLGTWTTKYIPGPANGGGVNIQVPTRSIDGYVVQPGEQFDFFTAIGPITSPPYESGGVLIHGQIKEDGAIGGGMCSCSTTLFNAALRAGLQIDARGNHSIYISRYPVGLDATVWMSGKTRRTMAFTNDTEFPVLIKGINERGKVTFELYGIDDGRTVTISEPRIANVKEATRLLEYSDRLAPGVRRLDQEPYDGFDSWVTRTVRDASGNVIHEETYFSDYRMLAAISLVGRYPGDPPAGTRIPASAYPGPPSPPTPEPPDPDPDPTNPPPTQPPPPGGSAPVAKFVWSPDSNTKRIFFNSTSTGSISSYAWDFGDGSGSGKQNPSHTYAAAGSYTVTLTVTNANGSSSKTRNITVHGGGGNPNPTDPPPSSNPPPTDSPSPTNPPPSTEPPPLDGG